MKLEKKFKDLESGDHIFTIELSTQNIISYPIKEVKGMGNTAVKITIYKIQTFQNVSNDTILESAKGLGRDEELPTEILYMPLNSVRAMTTEAVPRIFSPTRENLEQWMVKDLKSK